MTNHELHNPYIAGPPLHAPTSFFGRERTLRMVEETLISPEQNAVVLFGQRRIGKTSILRQLLHRLNQQSFKPFYIDLIDCSALSLGEVLYRIAATIAQSIDMPFPKADLFDDDGTYFRHTFLPALYTVLDAKCRPVLLLDEFDVLDVTAESAQSPTVAALTFFPYLRQLMEQERRMGFVFVIGRRVQDLPTRFKLTFKTAPFRRISVLNAESARELTLMAQRLGSLIFDTDAVNRILALTSGHPYLTQLFCRSLWERSYPTSLNQAARIDVTAVNTVIATVLESGQNAFEWIWDGLPPAERIICAIIAKETAERPEITDSELLSLLDAEGGRMLVGDQERALETLVEWELLRKTESGYGFFIELIRQWVADTKPLHRVKSELDALNPLADALYQNGNNFYKRHNLKNAERQLQQALEENPDHLKARLLLGQVLVEQGHLDEGVRELEEVYRYDRTEARKALIEALCTQGKECQRANNLSGALTCFDRVLVISPNESNVAGWRDHVMKLMEHSAEASEYERQEAWEQALIVYRELVEADAHEPRWRESVARVQIELDLARKYGEAVTMSEQRQWLLARRLFAEILHLRPDYRDAQDHYDRAFRHMREQVEKPNPLVLPRWLVVSMRTTAILISTFIVLVLVRYFNTPAPGDPSRPTAGATTATLVAVVVATAADLLTATAATATQLIRTPSAATVIIIVATATATATKIVQPSPVELDTDTPEPFVPTFTSTPSATATTPTLTSTPTVTVSVPTVTSTPTVTVSVPTLTSTPTVTVSVPTLTNTPTVTVSVPTLTSTPTVSLVEPSSTVQASATPTDTPPASPTMTPAAFDIGKPIAISAVTPATFILQRALIGLTPRR